MRLLLSPPASTWFDELDPEVSSDVQKLDSAFRDRFITNKPAWVLEQQLWGRTMQPTEGLDAYITAIDSLCARLQKPDVDRITSIVRGLTPSLRPFVIQQDPKTFSAAVQAARLVPESMSMATILESTPQAQETSVSSLQPSSSLADAISQQAKELQELKEQLKTITAQPVVAAASVHITCQLCRNTGHSATDCQLYINRGGQGQYSRRRTLTCSYCSRRGHLEKDCYTKRRKLSQSQNRQHEQSQSTASLNRTAPST